MSLSEVSGGSDIRLASSNVLTEANNAIFNHGKVYFLASNESMDMKFNYDLNYKEIDFRNHPELYHIGKGEQGVLLVEPYKSEILPYWRFKTSEIARESAEKIYELFLNYKEQNDFVGMDMARKFLQMGYTRSRRYANHKSGRKWNEARTEVLPNKPDEEKGKSAAFFYTKYLQVKNDPFYIKAKKSHLETYEK